MINIKAITQSGLNHVTNKSYQSMKVRKAINQSGLNPVTSKSYLSMKGVVIKYKSYQSIRVMKTEKPSINQNCVLYLCGGKMNLLRVRHLGHVEHALVHNVWTKRHSTL